MKISRQDVREEAAHLDTLGFTFDGVHGGHFAFVHPDYGRMVLQATPSESKRWRHNFRTQLAKKMGISKGELERRLGIRTGGNGRGIRRERNHEGIAQRRMKMGAIRPIRREEPIEPGLTGTPDERRQQIAEEIHAADYRLRTAIPDTPVYHSYLARVCRLQHEYMELEAA